MPKTTFLCRIALTLAAWLLMPNGAALAGIGDGVAELMDNQRRILVLRETAGHADRAEARRAGQYLFFRNQQLRRTLVADMTHAAAEIPERYRELAQAMDLPAYVDEDRLALRGLLEALARRLPPDQRHDAAQRLERLAELRRHLGGDFAAALQQVPLKSAHAAGARWQGYIARLSGSMTAAQILAELDRDLIAAPAAAPEAAAAAARAHVLEWNGEELPDRAVLLTFDDGPHAVHTPAVLDILKENAVHALFFQIGHNLGTIKNGVAQPEHHRDVEARLLAEGHAVGNHSYSHPVLTRLDGEAVAREIADTQALIEALVPPGAARSAGFRPPYGARNDAVLAQIDRQHLRSMVWNIDSEDWADTVPESIAHRVVGEAEKYGRGIVLMHDIHARTVEALPIVIRELKARGFRFMRWNGQRLVAEAEAEAEPAAVKP